MSQRWTGENMTYEAAQRAVWDVDDDWDTSALACVDLIEPHLGLEPGDRVVDLGCGVGRLTIPLAIRHSECQLIGLDVSPRMIWWAMQRSQPNNIEWQIGEIVPPCEAVFSMLVFQHLDRNDVANYITKVCANLTPGGRFRFQFVRGDYHAIDHHQYPSEWMLGQLAAHGLEVLDVENGTMYDEWTWVTAGKP